MNRSIPLLLICFVFVNGLSAQYWQQQVDYAIDVTLDDQEHALNGFESLVYYNNSPDTLRFIWFHLWPNAYKNDKTAFSEQRLRHGDTRFYFSKEEEKGYINRLNFEVDGRTATMEDHPLYIDVIRLILPEPLPPRQSARIATSFHVKLPANFSRGGHEGDSYQVTQWYPKAAVYDQHGWHEMPYLEDGEYYSDFGNYEVSISVPANYVVAATGELDPTNSGEKAWLQQRIDYQWKPLVTETKKKGAPVQRTVQPYPLSDPSFKQLNFSAKQVIDFAWFADKRFRVRRDRMQLPSGKWVDIGSYYLPDAEDQWKYSLEYLKEALQFYSDQLGDYPYPAMDVVLGPVSGGGGMEYPGITLISPMADTAALHSVILHETGHNWFQATLASNERDHPWMDEGMNTFYQKKFLGSNKRFKVEKLLLETAMALHRDQPMATSSVDFTLNNYSLVPYLKTAGWLEWIQSQTGSTAFEAAMRKYYQEWRFRHPTPEDFRESLETSLGSRLPDSSFAILHQTGPLPSWKRTGTRTGFVLSKSYRTALLEGHQRQLIGIGPAIGYNLYDQLLLGGFITNYALPPTRFRFFAAPMYSTGAKTIRGLGTLEYYAYPATGPRQIRFSLTAAHFGKNQYSAENGEEPVFAFTRLVPGIRFQFRETPATASRTRYLQWKTYWIGEEQLQVYRDTLINGSDTSYRLPYRKLNDRYTINQLAAVVEDSRALYPYRVQLKVDQGNDFVKPTFTADYFFNYPKKGGLSVRFFAGKFLYLGEKNNSKQFRTDRYQLNMTGANGYEDYTYSDYFIGRNEYQGMASQQIMLRDGAFKVRTDLLSDKVGKTDDWLIATNWETTVPDGINPFNLLPIKIPLRVFADVGTYAGAWAKNSDASHFLFDAGLSLSLLKNTVHVYVPLLYSRVYRDYFKSTLPPKGRWLKTVSFAIDLSNFELRQKLPNLTF